MGAVRDPFAWLIGVLTVDQPAPVPVRTEAAATRRGESRLSPTLRDAVQRLAPRSPPCFHDRLAWVEYVTSAASVKREPSNEPLPLVFEAGKPVRFDMSFDFCRDCVNAAAMRERNLCRPTWLLDDCKEKLNAA